MLSFYFRLIRHRNDLMFIRRPRSSLPDGFKMDKLSGSCYFLERRLPDTSSEDVLWKKLQSVPRKRRDVSPTKASRYQQSENWTVSSSKEKTLEVQGAVKINGISFHKENGVLGLNGNEDEVFLIQSFKETSV